MKVNYEIFGPEEPIPVNQYIKNRKMSKYFGRETAAALVCLGKLLDKEILDPEIPFFYAYGIVEHENYGLEELSKASADEKGHFSENLFVKEAMPLVSPLTQFKVLYNMSASFVSIEHALVGENAVVYASAQSLLEQLSFLDENADVLLGAGKILADGSVAAGFALGKKSRILALEVPDAEAEAIELFEFWAGKERVL